MQSMYIFKQPRIGGAVNCHQDSTYFVTDPLSVIGLWFALEDATVENGCLWGIPKAHDKPLQTLFKRAADNKSGYHETIEGVKKEEWDMSKAVALEVPQGSMVVLHGQFPHFSKDNRSDKSRHAYTLHLIDGATTYHPQNWLQRPDIPIRDFNEVVKQKR